MHIAGNTTHWLVFGGAAVVVSYVLRLVAARATRVGLDRLDALRRELVNGEDGRDAPRNVQH